MVKTETVGVRESWIRGGTVLSWDWWFSTKWCSWLLLPNCFSVQFTIDQSLYRRLLFFLFCVSLSDTHPSLTAVLGGFQPYVYTQTLAFSFSLLISLVHSTLSHTCISIFVMLTYVNLALPHTVLQFDTHTRVLLYWSLTHHPPCRMSCGQWKAQPAWCSPDQPCLRVRGRHHHWPHGNPTPASLTEC